MQEWLTNNILMYSTHTGGRSRIAERFIKTLMTKTYKIMTVIDSKSFPYLNLLVDQYNNTYHHSINKKPINTDCSVFTEKIVKNFKTLKFKVHDQNWWVIIIKYKNVFRKGYTENCWREIFIIDSVWKTNPWTYKIKDLNEEKIIGSCVE